MGIELRPIVKVQKEILDYIDYFIGDYIEELDIPIFNIKGIKYIARRDISLHPDVNISDSNASKRDKILRENDLYWHDRETIPYKEYKKRERIFPGGKSIGGAHTIILLSVDDAIVFISYGQSDLKKLNTIKKIVRELKKYKNIAINGRKLRLEDCWRNILHYDDLAYVWIINKMNEEKIPFYNPDPKIRTAYRLLWDDDIWRIGKIELYRYLHLKGVKLPFFNECRLHHEELIKKHLFSKGEIIHKNEHKQGRIGKIR